MKRAKFEYSMDSAAINLKRWYVKSIEQFLFFFLLEEGELRDDCFLMHVIAEHKECHSAVQAIPDEIFRIMLFPYFSNQWLN